MTSVIHPTVYHNKCVCQICTCTKHKCPHALLDLPLEDGTTYSGDYHKHPITVWAKPNQSGPPQDRHYDYINSAYREHYPGHPVGARDKHKPRVKDEDGNLPFKGNSEYKTNFGPKTAKVDHVKGKDSAYKPTNQPFDGSTTYKDDFTKKKIPGKTAKQTQIVDFPPGYKFNGETTYGNSYLEHPVGKTGSYKPQERIGDKGPHDLNTIYRQDYVEKPFEHQCPILNLPKYSNKIYAPYSHYGYDSAGNHWFPKA